MKITTLLLSLLFCFFFQPNEVQSKDDQGTHTFKIVGNKEIFEVSTKKIVEYDPESNDHLYISYSDNLGNISSKSQYLFTGKKFNTTVGILAYLERKQLLRDGLSIYNRKDGTIEKTIVYKKDKVVSQTSYYPNGQKQRLLPGTYSLNGEYKLWYPNGQLSFSGSYKGNLKDGDFEQFDESGALIKKGTYKEGKLVSGEAVVADIVYDNPDVYASFVQGEEYYDNYLTNKAASADAPKMVFSKKVFHLYITFDKNGKMTDIKNSTAADSKEEASIQYLLKDFPAFSPAMVESISVKSQQRMSLQISKSGVLLRAEERAVTDAEEMPEFPGGERAMLAFLSSNLKYPQDANVKGIQGRVFVSFEIDKMGKIEDAWVIRGAYPSLDDEAIRVVKSMPKWKPGMVGGEPVNVLFTLPVNFSLQRYAPSPVN